MIMEKIKGRHDVSYEKLTHTINAIKLTNLGSHASISWDSTPLEDDVGSSNAAVSKQMFKRLLISYKGCTDGLLKGYRFVIGVDGCHLNGPFGCV